MVPSASFDLDNIDRVYSAENTGSPIYGYIAPDRPVRVSVQNVAVTDLLTGAIDEPIQQPDRTERSVGIQMLGAMAELRGREISTILYQGIRTDEAITVILDAVGWPAADRVLAVGDTVLNFWWLDHDDAWDALMELLETEGAGASVYEDGSGGLHFENRNYRDMVRRSTIEQAWFYEKLAGHESDFHIPYAPNLSYQRFSYTSHIREIFNTARITTRRRELSTLGTAWTDKPLVLGASESRPIVATSSDPWTNVQNVTATTDYAVLSGALASVTTSVISATRVSITWTAGTNGAVVVGPASDPASGPQLRAQVAETIDEPEVEVTSLGTTVTRPRTLPLTDGIRREIGVGYAQSLCNAALAFHKEHRPSIAIEFSNVTAADLAQIGVREISDRIGIAEAETGLARTIHIEQINHEINHGGREHRCALIGSAAPNPNPPGLWGVTTNGGWGTAEWTD
jgi:hypothetical protein